MLQEVSLVGAMLAGLLSFVSPCVLPLVPPYLGFLAGTSLDEIADGKAESEASRRVFFTSIAFVLGFSTVFVALGASASLIGQTISQHLQILGYIAGVVIIIMGLHFLGVFRIALLYREARVQVQRKPAGLGGAYVLGLAFAFGWTPCVGPILAAILFVAGSEDTVARGALLLSAYALGMGIPFLAAALFAGPFLRFMQKFRRHMRRVEQAMGVFMILTGILFLSGQLQVFSFWLLETFPIFSQIG
ncbi:cytochrome c biogenesis protein CcdA [Microvirga tunisiensis]|uniref:Cytochrome c biogenesis protein CcdA n=2 Tax=Pannonibacter tanglangensis TaxID=2750084 RepID=A0ABW9ZB87_9HYPH|nr:MULTISPECIES: cytochrome c biogenesis protein CcdA [unclassified Pannonibacter]NBN62093.1 cytochrome c biogenesis protein CcdA [Pannonibacter sp. XCT-34]NBN77763.1 cytochrome c biogenesis protein CcdA [Pannonibacter sp. XCT-53]